MDQPMEPTAVGQAAANGDAEAADSLPPAPLGDPEDGSVPDATGEDATAGQRLSALSKMVPKARPKMMQPGSNEEKLYRVSIKFKVGNGWRGSKNRDFPGRLFRKSERAVLMDWAEQFRQGESIKEHQEDKRSVQLPPNQKGAQRRKPFIGNTTVHRPDAFHWLRMTHARLLDTIEKKDPALLANVNANEDVLWNTVSVGILSFIPPVAQLKSRRSDPEVLVEIVWNPSQIDQLMAGMRSTGRKGTRVPFRVLLNIGGKPIKVNLPSSSGRGAYFNISEVAPGKYSVNGAHLTVLEPKSSRKSNLGKRPRRASKQRKSLKNTSSSNSHSTPTHDMKKRRVDSSKSSPRFALHYDLDALRPSLQIYQSASNELAHIFVDDHDFEYALRGVVDLYDEDIKHIATPLELAFLRLMKAQMGDLLRTEPICWWPEVVGDISLLRYLRGCNGVVKDAIELFKEHLIIREKYNMNKIRMLVFSKVAKHGTESGNLQYASKAVTHLDVSSSSESYKNLTSLEDLYGGADISKLSTYSIHDFSCGSLLSDCVRIECNACMTPEGNPVEICGDNSNVEVGIKKIGFARYAHHVIEMSVRRSIQLDILSRQQHRMVLVEKIVMESSARRAWQFFAPGQIANLLKVHANAVQTMPTQCNRIHWIPQSWAIGMFFATLLPWLPDSLRKSICVYDLEYKAKLILNIGKAAGEAALAFRSNKSQDKGYQLKKLGDETVCCAAATMNEAPASHGKAEPATPVPVGIEMSMSLTHPEQSGKITVQYGKPFEISVAFDVPEQTSLKVSWDFSTMKRTDEAVYEAFLMGRSDSETPGKMQNSLVVMERLGIWYMESKSGDLPREGIEKDYATDQGVEDVMGVSATGKSHGTARPGSNNIGALYTSSCGHTNLASGVAMVLFRVYLQRTDNGNAAPVAFKLTASKKESSCASRQLLTSALTENSLSPTLRYEENANLSFSSHSSILSSNNIGAEIGVPLSEISEEDVRRAQDIKESIFRAVSEGRLSSRIHTQGAHSPFTNMDPIEAQFDNKNGSRKRGNAKSSENFKAFSKQFADQASPLGSPSEIELLNEMRRLLGDLLTTGRPAKCPEVVGNISLLRYLRGNNNDVNAAVEQFREMLQVREHLRMDDFRDLIMQEVERRGGVASHEGFQFLSQFTAKDLPIDKRISDYAVNHGWELNAGVTEAGDPIFLSQGGPGQFTDFISVTSFEDVQNFVVMTHVLRQLQIDILSRIHKRLIQTVFIIANFKTGGWKFLMPGPHTSIPKILALLTKVHTMHYRAVHIVLESWIMRAGLSTIMFLFPNSIQRVVTIHSSDGYVESLLPSLRGPMIAQLTRKLKELISEQSKSPKESSSVLHTLTPWVQTQSKKHILVQRPPSETPSSFEVAIRVDPLDPKGVYGVQWNFEVTTVNSRNRGRVLFVVYAVEWTEEFKPGSEILFPDIPPHKYALLPEQNVLSHQGGVMWPSMQQGGVILLRWTHNDNGEQSTVSACSSSRQRDTCITYSLIGVPSSSSGRNGVEAVPVKRSASRPAKWDSSMSARPTAYFTRPSLTSSSAHFNDKDTALLHEFRTFLFKRNNSASWLQFHEVVGDWALLRFLRSCEFNLDKAISKFQQHVSVRREFNLDVIRNRVMLTTSQEKLIEFDQKDVVHGAEIAKFLLIEYSIGWDPAGRLVTLFSVVGPLLNWLSSSKTAAQMFREYILEAYVRRMIQLDLLSRKYGKLVMLNNIVNNLMGGAHWKLLIPGRPRSVGRMWLQLMSSKPSCLDRMHWLKANWALRGFARATKLVNMGCSVFFYGSSDLNELQNLRDDIGEHAFLKLKQTEKKLSTLRKSCSIHCAHFPFMIADQTSGEIALTSERDRSHEILFEIDAREARSIGWRFEVIEGGPVTFSMSILHEDGVIGSSTDTTINYKRPAVSSPLDLLRSSMSKEIWVDSKVRENLICKRDVGVFEFPEGCAKIMVICRWSLNSPAPTFFSSLTCSNRVAQDVLLSYDVEIKKRRRQSEDALDPLFDRSIYSAAEVGVQGFEVPNLMHAYGVSGSGNHAHVDDPFGIHAQDVHEQQMMDDLQDDVVEFFGSDLDTKVPQDISH